MQLFAANGTPIETYGNKQLSVDLGLRRAYRWIFIIANVKTAILGADFLYHHGLILDLKSSKLIDSLTTLRTSGSLEHTQQLSISTINSQSNLHTVIKQFIELTGANTYKLPTSSNVCHRIIVDCQPIAEPLRRYAGEKFKAIKEEFDLLLQLGVIRPSSSPWSSPIHVVKKKTGGWRACGDYRKLNAHTTPDRYPIPRLDDIGEKLYNQKIFSKIDINKAYYNIPMDTNDIEKTAVRTPFGLFEFVVMPFGLRNATQTFQRYMDSIFRNMDYVFCYLDDILIFSENEDQHEQHVHCVLEKLKQSNLSINASKCEFGVDKITFLGYEISSDGWKPPDDRISAIKNYPKPKTILEMRRFVGILNFYRKFIPKAAELQSPLNTLFKGGKKNDERLIEWTPLLEASFNSSKDCLATVTVLNFLSPDAPLRLTTDASDVSVGAHLEQYSDDQWKPIGFFSTKLKQSQRNYSVYDRELLAVYLAIKYFKHILDGRDFSIRTDHKPLIYAFQQKSDKASPRQLRQLSYIAQFSTNLIYINGSDNIIADALSRINEITMPTHITLHEIQNSQNTDLELQKMFKNNNTGLSLQRLQLEPDITVICDTSTSEIRPYIPQNLQRKLFDSVHSLAHPGSKSTLKQIRKKYVWISMNRDVVKWVKECINCQRAKIMRHNHVTPGQFPKSDRFDHVHIDIIVLPEYKGYRYCLTMIDRFSRWPEIAPLKDMFAETVAEKFYSTWIARFGSPKTITTDQGSQFESALFAALSKLIGAHRIHTTPYHPASNGMIERWHRTLKASLMCTKDIPWVSLLPTVLLGLRTSYKEDIKASAAEMLYGTTLRLPGEFFSNEDEPNDPHTFLIKFREYIQQVRAKPAAHHNNNKSVFVHKDLYTTTHVFLRADHVKKPLEPPYSGPFEIVKRISDRVFSINVNGSVQNISVERLKPAFIAKNPDAEPAPLRTYERRRKVGFTNPESVTNSLGGESCGSSGINIP